MKLLKFESIVDHVKLLFFSFKGGAKAGQKAGFCVMLKYFEIKKADSVIDHRRRQNVVRTSVTHSATPRVPLFCSYHIVTSSVIYY